MAVLLLQRTTWNKQVKGVLRVLENLLAKTKPRQKYLDGLIGVGDEGDEKRQHHVDEQGDEGVEVGPAEEPHQSVFVLQLGEGGEHVVAVQQGEEALCYTTQALKLEIRERRQTGLHESRKCCYTVNTSAVNQENSRIELYRIAKQKLFFIFYIIFDFCLSITGYFLHLQVTKKFPHKRNKIKILTLVELASDVYNL